MQEPVTIPKSNPLLPAEDYTALRDKGIQSIAKLGSDIWTDYNNSDPGISILEAVCYAITDLAYRTDFDVKDLLAPENLNNNTWKQVFYTARQILHNNPLTINDYRKLVIDIKGVRNAWIEPSKDYEVPVWIDYNDVTIKDEPGCSCDDAEEQICYGKLGVASLSTEQVQAYRNTRSQETKAAIDKLAQEKTALETKITDLTTQIDMPDIDPTKKATLIAEREQLQDQVKDIDRKVKALNVVMAYLSPDRPVLPSKIVEFEGLYNVMIEYEEDVLIADQREEVRQLVLDRLSRHRNLCEDFLSINGVEYQDFGIMASIALEEYADPDQVLSQVFFIIYKYFTPSVPFYTIDQMQGKGYLIDEIFEGPALKHGFIDDEALERTDFFRDIRLSDIINEIADIKGIKAITYLHLSDGKDTGDAAADKHFFYQWLNYLREQRKVARIQPSLSPIIFCKERELITYNTGRQADRRPERMLKLFNDLKVLERKYKLEGHPTDLPIPTGEYMELEDYYPVTYSLPMCYGVSDRAGLPPGADEKRQVQALQLRGYLLFFEQLLAGYLVQLNHLRDLFTFDDTVKYTYFTRALTEIADLKDLVIDHGTPGEWNDVLAEFTSVLKNLIETPKLFQERRNDFLDHMLARFSEDLSEYETLSGWLTPYKVKERMIQDKIRILKDGEYYQISTNRSKAYNYAQPDIWDTPNVSGTERRVSRLLGFRNAKRRTLAPDFIVVEPVMETDEKTKSQVWKKNKKGQYLNVVKVVDPENHETVLLTSIEVADGCCTEMLISQLLEYADERNNFRFHDELRQRSRKSAGQIGTFWFELWDGTDPENASVIANGEKFDKQEDREKAFKRLQHVLDELNDNEGMHLVEHLLLRPKFDGALDEAGNPIPVGLPDICLDLCDLGRGLNQNTEVPPYKKRVYRIPAEKCYDNLPWVLEFIRKNDNPNVGEQSFLFQEAFPDGAAPVPLKFRRYENLAKRVKDLQEYGSERVNYTIVSNGEEDPAKAKYSFIIHGDKDVVLAQSSFIFNMKSKKEGAPEVADDIEKEIALLMRYFGYLLDLYCEADACDNNEDPYSFRATILFPCWPKRFRDKTFRNLVEKTLQTESPAHVYLHVMWVGINEMQRFEKVYFDWLQEMAQTEMPSYEKVNPLVDVLNTLQPCGVCEDDCGQ
ncbi:hypothetical protein F0L74_24065 [Chitinophaga agrisoli]|uniref:Uncharacterized protein n=1 Tax=Chitinophaga agrisoli TaxID=2607653 RepID=A0A5B2VJZ4_9BACT|nr:hypothetical protein [Chitinophaga agrisoli]KAA2239285.1 hypothetical protein F0L74_24065 [Chitinophaga agrisoli]